MNHNKHQLPESEYIDLEQYGQLLFDASLDAPKLTKTKKRAIVKNITGSYFTLPAQLGFGFLATAMAAFILVFSIAQVSKPGSALYNLKIGPKKSQVNPIDNTPPVSQTVIEQKQSEIDDLRKSGAPDDDIIKAESELEKLIESSKNIDSQKQNTNSKSDDNTESLKIEDFEFQKPEDPEVRQEENHQSSGN
jgi:hypothetical protein